jgi:hypothetical protein
MLLGQEVATGEQPMKLRLLTVILATMLGLSLQCSQDSKRAGDSSKNTSVSTSQSESNAESKRRYDAMESEIESLSKELGIDNLKAIQGRDEIRVWVGFGVTQPRLFILKLLDEPQASFYTMRTSLQANDERRLNVPQSTPLSSPRSGWAEFENFLKTQGLDTPVRLTQESSDYLRSPDVQVIAIETRLGDKYSLVFYHLDNPSDDAKRALTVCKRIEADFNVNMYCGA